MIRLLTWVLWVVAIALLSMSVPLGHQPMAQTVSTELATNDREALEQIAKYLGGRPPIDGILKALGFDPTRHAPVPPDAFAKWPDLRKVEQAYRAALAEGGEEAGQRALRGVARKIADRTDAIRYERTLKMYFPEPTNTPLTSDDVKMRFRLPTKTSQFVPVADGVRAVVIALSRYVSPVPGGIPSLMAHCCGISDSEAYRLLSTAPSNEAALAEAIRTSPIPPAFREKLVRAIRHVAERNQAFIFERVVTDTVTTSRAATAATSNAEIDTLARDIAERALRESDLGDAADRLVAEPATVAARSDGSTPHASGSAAASADNREAYRTLLHESRGGDDLPPSTATSTGGGGGGGGGGGSRATSRGGGGVMAAKAPAVVPSLGGGGGPRVGGHSFRRLIGRGGGFGGIVFGNSLRHPDGFRVHHVSWSSAGGDASGRRFGRLTFVADDGRVAFGATLPEDIAYAAVALVLDGVDGILPPIEMGDAAPLAGVAPLSIAWPVFDSNAAQPSVELGTQFAVNPALDGLPLGYSAVLADAIPFMTSNILARLKHAGASKQELDFAREWLDRRDDWGFYKIIDAPLEILVLNDGFVDVRSVPPTAQPEALRTTSLLTMAILSDESEETEQFGTTFYQAVPALVRAYPPFADLNAFAEAFALVRWAKQDGARWGSRPSKPSRGAALHFVVVIGNTTILASPAHVVPQLESILKQADIHGGKLAIGARAAIATSAELTALRRQAIAQALAARRVRATVPRSDAEREKLDEVADGLLERATTLLDEAQDKLQAALQSGADFVKQDMQDRLIALDRQMSEHFEAVSSLRLDWSKLTSYYGRFQNAPASVKSQARHVMQEIQQGNLELLEKGDTITSDQRAAKIAAINTLRSRLNAMLPVDADAVAVLEKKIDLARRQYEHAQKEYERAQKESDSMPEFKRLHDWFTLQNASTEVTRDVVSRLPAY